MEQDRLHVRWILEIWEARRRRYSKGARPQIERLRSEVRWRLEKWEEARDGALLRRRLHGL